MDNLANGNRVQSGRRYAGTSVGIELAAVSGEHCALQPGNIIAKLSLPRGDRDFLALAHRQDSTAHGAPPAPTIRMSPRNDRGYQNSDKLRVARKNPEAAGLVFRPHRRHIVVIDDHSRRFGDEQAHHAPFARCRASSKSPSI
jgi:hypothetical protein